MDLERMLAMCRRDQWHVDDLDWSVPPRAMPREHEEAVCQYFEDMSGIELLAGELFKVQRDRATDPVVREIFHTFVLDEARHAVVARRLSRHYDVHRYRRYERNPHLVRFAKHFVHACRYLSAEIANAYITAGELLLDIALLRSIDDFVDDEMSRQAMTLINRDESRHIAMDYYMTEYYASEAYRRELASMPPRPPAETLAAYRALVAFMWHAAPFFRAVFFEPMDLVDPGGRRLQEAFKRMQLLGTKPGVAERPFTRFMRGLQDAFHHPWLGPMLAPVIARIMGVEPRVIRRLYTEDEARRVARMSFEELAQEALAAKYVN
ncbi:MAG: diiron oxygenase [Myxococcota bacterium]|nr:diiron oxygenase [Myxococcota bacterium]MDW8361450.1 hypothetical protein [Myxococcales bacterium]